MTEPRAPSPAARLLGLAAGFLVLAAGAAAVVAWRWPRQPPPAVADTNPDPRLTYPTPYRNVRPEVQYVGDEACAQCHDAVCESFHQHPMGRSMVPMSRAARAAKAGDDLFAALLPAPLGGLLARTVRHETDRLVHNPFTSFGHEFRVERRGDRVYHVEAKRDNRGRVIAEVRQEVLYDMGAGAHGHSYLVERDGCLYQSPITWFTRARRWDLSPGFSPNHHFDRPVSAECLFCHSNYADAVPHTLNRYRTPAFHGLAIGCERCHGPGELHVREREAGDVPAGQLDDTIVNPRDLEPPLREAVCQQCHLKGMAAVVRRGRQPFDFRPGLPLQLFYTVFVQRGDLPERMVSVSHVEQMAVSGCYRGSGGRLGCISCHDPHVLPPVAERPAYYRDKCRQCHQEGGDDCTLDAATRRHQNGDDCTACHMPRTPNQDVSHTAATDHRIPRRPGQVSAHPQTAMAPPRPGDVPLVPFHRDLPGPGERELNRDLGLALVAVARKMPERAAPVCARALPLLEEAVATWPDDLDAWEGRVYALIVLERREEALDAAETALARQPDHEQLLSHAAWLCQVLDRPLDGLTYCRKALAIAPSSPLYRITEADLLLQLRDWDGAIASAKATEKLDPLLPEPHAILAVAYGNQGRRKEAGDELTTLAALDPDRAEEVRRRFGGALR